MADYLWHEISDNERKKIEKESKDLILSFGDALEKLPKLKIGLIERDKGIREETKVCNPDKEFRDIMLKNADNVKDDCIVAEKGEWTK